MANKLHIHTYTFYGRTDSMKHEITINFCARRVYEVLVDGEFYATAESKFQAHEEAADILKHENWSPVRMCG